MSEMLKYIKHLFGIPSSEDLHLHNKRKRRLMADNNDLLYTTPKFRKIDNFPTFNNNEDWIDIPTTSKYKLISKYLCPLKQKYTARSKPRRTAMQDVIDISDDDDVVEITPRKKEKESKYQSDVFKDHESIMWQAKKSLINSSRVLNGDFNNTIRHDEEQLYRNMLLSSPTTSSVYTNIRNDYDNYPNSNYLFSKFENSRTKKMFENLNAKKNANLIDLTIDDKIKSGDPIVIKDSSDSDADSDISKQKIKPVNSLKVMLDVEPCVSPTYLTKREEERKQRQLETEKLIQEEQLKRNKFNNVNRENRNSLLELKLKNCKIADVILLDETESDSLSFPEFTPDQEAKINQALNCRHSNRVFVEKFNLRITGADLKLLNEKEWLNDEVINFYVNMIQERSERNNLPKVYSFSTFFYPKLISCGYSSLRRWTKRVDIFSKDIIVVPVHLGFHWCMAIIDFRDKSIRYYDSMLGQNMQCLTALENYLRDEHRDKKKSDYDTRNWKKVIMKDIPRQMNGSDCGVFSCTFAEFITRNAKILFTQEHMPYIRRKMVIEIIEGNLLT